ncbi:MAG: hypothetical protein LAO24_04430 [Acidobacteriia bacterium]|nr:hypothetical protein [Terriglobia bacterium]
MTSGRWISHLVPLCVLLSFFVLPVMAQHSATLPATPPDVLTYRSDNLRIGWFSSETQLNVSNVNSTSFGLLKTVTLDGRVDAEPLYVFQQSILNKGIHFGKRTRR